MVAGDKQAVLSALYPFKYKGIIKFNKLLEIPIEQRIPQLTKTNEGRGLIAAAISGALKSAMENINIRIGLTEDQLLELTELIIDESHEDCLALEDIVLFLQQLVVGKIGVVNDRMDIPTFFKLFEIYRDDRHKALIRARYEQNVNYKSLGPSDRSSDDYESLKEKHRNQNHDHKLKDFMDKMYKNPPK